jgi:hypothetical protein
VDHRDHRGVRADQLSGVIHIQPAGLVDLDVPDRRTRSLGDLLPGDERGVVFHLGEHDLVFGSELPKSPGVGDEVLCLGGV